MSRNNLEMIPTGFFDNLVYLRNLYLNGNQLRNFDALDVHNYMVTIHLRNNDIETVGYMDFSSLSSLNSL